MTTQSVVTRAPKRQYANDGSYESVKAMLIQLAAKFYRTVVLPQGLPMDIDDVMQEVNTGYVKAKAKWQPEKAKFTTYCYTVATNEFFARIERMQQDRANLGLFSTTGTGDFPDDSDDDTLMMDQGTNEDAPDELINRREEIKNRLASLSPPTLAIVADLLRSELMRGQQQDKVVLLRELVKARGFQIDTVMQVEQELDSVYGVKVNLAPWSKRPQAAA